jgi:hypothetical protein
MLTAPQCPGLPSAHPLHSRRSAALARETRESVIFAGHRPSVDLSDLAPTVDGHFLPKQDAQPHQCYRGSFHKGDDRIRCDYAVKGGQNEPIRLLGLDQGPHFSEPFRSVKQSGRGWLRELLTHA